jgi:hypothetical protein
MDRDKTETSRELQPSGFDLRFLEGFYNRGYLKNAIF